MGWFGRKNDDTTSTANGTATATLPAPAGLPAVPGYLAGTWTIDASHSEVSFTVRHMAVSKVRGRLGAVSGELVTAEDPTRSTVTATVDVTSLTTFNEQRDAHVHGADFFDVATHPSATFVSTALTHDGEEFRLTGDLTLKGVTRPVTLTLEVSGFGPDAYGGTRAGFSAKGRIDRRDFGISFDAKLDNGGLVVADKVDLELDVEAVLNA
ncbi:YceI family protein [Paenibacillus sp. TRM 82003]|uniref:YceI family protein n=1 Tax=Kineococcus sp. TRM81007 TaxID=2925831 RepID=UPI001F567F27|nr:YceI family protein [Kineococcus sp. TRM81007]MCI2237590.1 YceI family protein [Kineococcus sp. TRM81007]MCI3921838.1 YceI family protein [Paenibacillus sp. TRM 82003]